MHSTSLIGNQHIVTRFNLLEEVFMFGLGFGELSILFPILAVIALIVAIPTVVITVLVMKRKRGANE